MRSPCLYCERRMVGCRESCPEWADWEEQKAQAKANKAADDLLNDYTIKSFRKIRKKYPVDRKRGRQ